MPVTALSTRPARTGRSGHAAARKAPADPPALTVTVAIALTDDSLTPQAHRLLEAVRELVEAGNGSVSYDPSPPPPAPAPVAAGPEVHLLSASRQVLLDGLVLPLTRLEFDLLQFLADHPRRVFTRAQLLHGVWGYEHTGERTVDVHVRRLRGKLGSRVPLITTVYGVGYRLADDARVTVRPHD